MDFNPNSLKHQFSQLDYMVTRLKAKIESLPIEDIHYEQSQELLKNLTFSRSIVREWCNYCGVKLRR